MLEAFLLTNQPLVVLAGDVSVTRVEALQPSSRATPTTSGGSTSSSSNDSDIVFPSSAKRLAETSSGGSSNKRHASEGIGVQRPRKGPPSDETATSAHDLSSGVQQTPTTSHRHPRAAHGKRSHIVNIGKAEDHSLLVTVNYNEDSFLLAMPKVDMYDHTPHALLSNPQYHLDKDKWDQADLREVKSLVLEHKVWDVRPLPEGRSAITPKWVYL